MRCKHLARVHCGVCVGRLLDKEYDAVIRAAQSDFDYTKLRSIRELAGETVEEFMADAHSRLEVSQKKAWMSAFQAFRP